MSANEKQASGALSPEGGASGSSAGDVKSGLQGDGLGGTVRDMEGNTFTRPQALCLLSKFREIDPSYSMERLVGQLRSVAIRSGRRGQAVLTIPAATREATHDAGERGDMTVELDSDGFTPATGKMCGCVRKSPKHVMCGCPPL